MILSLVVAMAENGVIGRRGQLPWHLPADLRRFRKITMGRSLVMGRRTWESIGRVLPGRRCIVLSRRAGYRAGAGAEVTRSLDEALELCAQEKEVFVVGGAAVYSAALARCRRLYVTLVHARVEGDVCFPDPSLAGFRLLREERRPADAANSYDLSFRLYERVCEGTPAE